jgi:hypothetical protein
LGPVETSQAERERLRGLLEADLAAYLAGRDQQPDPPA